MTTTTSTATAPAGPTAHRLGLALTLGTLLALVLGAGALGIVGEGGAPDRAYVMVPVVVLLGSALARLRAAPMVAVALAAALTQVVVTATLLLAEVHVAAGGNVPDVLMVNAGYAAGFLVAAGLFRRAS
ncbi:hypothetical protein [Nocardioides solisilvae]|uniref:hypothetical protein n=1 Tax=Nocardioides solisilvae TaxID=1542435 RepID=UPI0013A52E7F|nr:hypothetical protein [Nocardioides solisilvae]